MSCPAAVRDGAFLPPARHAPVDELFVARHAIVRAEAQALSDAGPKALEQRIGGFHQLEDEFHALRLLQVHRDGAAVAGQHIAPAPSRAADAIYADHLRAHVREHHAAERPGADASQFYDAESLQWAHALLPFGVADATSVNQLVGGDRGPIGSPLPFVRIAQ